MGAFTEAFSESDDKYNIYLNVGPICGPRNVLSRVRLASNDQRCTFQTSVRVYISHLCEKSIQGLF